MRKDFILGAFECDDGSIFPLEGFCFANQCSDILDEFDAQERFEQLDEVGVCDWSYSVLCSMQVGGGLTSVFPHLNANLSPIPLLCHFFFISFVRKSVLEFEILNLFFGLLEKYEARIKNQNFFTWMKAYNS